MTLSATTLLAVLHLSPYTTLFRSGSYRPHLERRRGYCAQTPRRTAGRSGRESALQETFTRGLVCRRASGCRSKPARRNSEPADSAIAQDRRGYMPPSITLALRGGENLNSDALIAAFGRTFEIVTSRVRPFASTISNCLIV